MDVRESSNIFIETANYFLELFLFDNETPLVVTFEPAGDPVKRPDGYRHGWGAVLLRQMRVSHMSVKPKVVDWYRRPDLKEAFEKLKEKGLFDRYSRVITYGGSMGGYAALAYARVLNAHTVLALNPQSSLRRDLVPWEDRFNSGLAYDWTLEEGDAATQCGGAQRVLVVVDRRFDMDWKHVARLPNHNLHVLNVPFVGHQMPRHLVEIRMALPLLKGAIAEHFDFDAFRKGVRARRDLKRYFSVLQNSSRVRSSERFKKIVQHHKEKSRMIGID